MHSSSTHGKKKKKIFFPVKVFERNLRGMIWRDFGTRDARALGVWIVNSTPRCDCFYFLFVASVGSGRSSLARNGFFLKFTKYVILLLNSYVSLRHIEADEFTVDLRNEAACRIHLKVSSSYLFLPTTQLTQARHYDPIFTYIAKPRIM